jgi:hypothetical protein
MNDEEKLDVIADRLKRRITLKGNKQDLNLSKAIETLSEAHKPKYTAYIFFDERLYPLAVSMTEPKTRPMRRKGEWVKLEK